MPEYHFPTELWQRIFAFACTDGGHMKCSLSLVSRYISECSRPFKLQSVAVHGLRQTLAFVAVLERTPAHFRQVNHLFISNDEPASSSTAVPSVSKWNALASTVFASLSPARASAKGLARAMESDIQMIHALYTIIHMYIYNTLRTLGIAFHCHHAVFPAHVPPTMRSPRVLDSLTELSLAYTAPTDAVFPEVLLRGPLAQLCPALRRLDLGGLMLHAYGAAPYLCARLGAIAPYLTHLKLSTKMALAGLVGVASTITQPPQTQHLLPTVTRVLIALEHHSTDTTCGGRPLPYNPPYASPPGPCECWRCLLLVTAAADERFVVVEGQGSFSAPVRWEWVLERCEVAWMDRVSGGEGSWDESKAVVK